jgi:hypothetical protein
MFSSRKTGSASNNYLLQKSLRFRSSASAYLNRTFASAGNRKTYTLSLWLKRGILDGSTNQFFFGSGVSTTAGGFYFLPTNQLEINPRVNNTNTYITTTQVFRDPSAWYHIVVALDTTQATDSNRLKLYVNGVQVTAFSTTIYPALNGDSTLNNNIAHWIGRYPEPGFPSPFDGYLAEYNFIDGQALTPSSFGSTNSATGVWQPIKYTGTYGTNGFYLPFTNTTSTSTLGNDFSGNSNTWTVNNISLTAGSTYDSMNDVPTLTSATAANYCTFNPVGIYVTTPFDGNLKFSGSSAGANGTMGASSGKFYWECVYTAIGSAEGVLVGIRSTDSIATGAAENVGYYGGGSENGKKTVNGVASAYAATWTTNDVIGVAVNLDGGTVTFYKNNVSQGAISFTVGGKTWTSFNWRTGAAGTNTGTINFGQQPFTYTPPTGFVRLNTFNLPTPTIGATASTTANKYMDVSLYTGNGSTQSITNSGSMQPDFVWLKRRSSGNSHGLFDSIRGVNNYLSSETTGAEATIANSMTAFNSNGFSLGTDSTWNSNTSTNVGWQWNAGGSTVTNTSGSISSQVRANTTAGFSIVTYTGTGSAATVGHGLGVAPKMIIVKSRSAAGTDWPVYHASLGATGIVALDATIAFTVTSTPWSNTAPTSSVFTVGTSGDTNLNTRTYVAYCFAQVAGYSAFGSYTGNGSTDGPFIYTGFRPEFILIKLTSSGGESWTINDAARNTYNVSDSILYPNLSDAEGVGAGAYIDFLSNGFKIRNNNPRNNSNGSNYIYMAFAESPFKYANAR